MEKGDVQPVDLVLVAAMGEAGNESRAFYPDLRGGNILALISNCGFFSFSFFIAMSSHFKIL